MKRKLIVELDISETVSALDISKHFSKSFAEYNKCLDEGDPLHSSNWTMSMEELVGKDVPVFTKQNLFYTPKDQTELAKWIEDCPNQNHPDIYMAVMMATNLLIDQVEKGEATIEVKS